MPANNSPKKSTDFLDSLSKELAQERMNGNLLISEVSAGAAVIKKPLVNPKEIFPALRKMLANAESEVLLQFYKIEKDSDGENDILLGLDELAKKAARQGKKIAVRLLVNRKGMLGETFHSKNTDNSFRACLSAISWIKELLSFDLKDPNSLQVFLKLDFSQPQKLADFINLDQVLNPELTLDALSKKLQETQQLMRKFANIFAYLDFQYVEHVHSDFGSYHSKMVVVDRHQALIMSGDPAKNRDYLVRNKEGELVKDEKGQLQHKQGWIEIGTQIESEVVGLGMVKNFAKCWNSDYTHALEGYSKLKLATHTEVTVPRVVAPLEKADELQAPMLFLAKKAQGLHAHGYRSPHLIATLHAIKSAAHTINICLPNLNTNLIITALADAVVRGVQVNIVLPKFANEKAEDRLWGMINGGSNQNAVKKLFAELRNRGCQDYEKIDVRWAMNGRDEIVQDGAAYNLHAKLIVVDNEKVITGSSLFDKQSCVRSQESDIIIDSQQVAARYNENFFTPVFNKSKDIFADKPFAQQIRLPAQELLIEAQGLLASGIEKFSAAKVSLETANPDVMKADAPQSNAKKEYTHLAAALGNSLERAGTRTLYGLSHTANDLQQLHPRKLKTANVAQLMSNYYTVCDNCHKNVRSELRGKITEVLNSIREWFVENLIPNWVINKFGSTQSIVYTAKYTAFTFSQTVAKKVPNSPRLNEQAPQANVVAQAPVAA